MCELVSKSSGIYEKSFFFKKNCIVDKTFGGSAPGCTSLGRTILLKIAGLHFKYSLLDKKNHFLPENRKISDH